MRLLVNAWSHFLLFNRSSDWEGASNLLALRNQFPDLEIFTPPVSACLIANLKYSLQKIGNKLPWNYMGAAASRYWAYLSRLSYLPPGYVRKIQADAIISYASDPWPFDGYRAARVQFTHIASELYFARAGFPSSQLGVEAAAKRWSLTGADVVICNDLGSTDRAVTHLGIPRERLRCIPKYQPEIEEACEEAFFRKHNDDGTVKILFVGGQGKRKGLGNLLEAWSRLGSPERAKAALTVVTNVAEGKGLRVPGGVRVIGGPLSHEEVYTLMEDSQIFVLPTLYDTYGRVIVEAMAMGCCVISSRQDPQDWLLDFGNAGWMVDPESVPEISAALERLISGKELRTKLAWKGRERFLEVFHHRVVGRRLYEAICWAVEHKSRSRRGN